MDCSITTNYIKEKKRMTKNDGSLCGISCAECPLYCHSTGKNCTCRAFQYTYPEDAIAIVQKWSDEHPQKTYQDDFFEKFPNAPKEDNGTPKCCRRNVYKKVSGNCYCGSKDKCYKCWNEAMSD